MVAIKDIGPWGVLGALKIVRPARSAGENLYSNEERVAPATLRIQTLPAHSAGGVLNSNCESMRFTTVSFKDFGFWAIQLGPPVLLVLVVRIRFRTGKLVFALCEGTTCPPSSFREARLQVWRATAPEGLPEVCDAVRLVQPASNTLCSCTYALKGNLRPRPGRTTSRVWANRLHLCRLLLPPSLSHAQMLVVALLVLHLSNV